MADRTVRLNVNINDEVAAALRELAAENDTTVTEIVRRSVSYYYFFRAQRDAGKHIELVAGGRRSRVELP